MTSSLEQLKQLSTVVADTGDFNLISEFTPQDATTNPSLLQQASQLSQYRQLVDDAVAYGRLHGDSIDQQLVSATDKLAVNFGVEILKLIPGRVSTEIDARLSFDTQRTIEKGRELIEMYKQVGVNSDRVLLKIAATWEGLQAAKTLEQEGLHCNLTLMFSLAQAMVAGEVGVTLISPFAGRITDWFKQRDKVTAYPPESDPGVVSVRQIFNYLKSYNYQTVVMGASFRSKEQVIALAGCDLLTVAPSILKELSETDVEVTRKLDAANPSTDIPKTILNESDFRLRMNRDEMADFKLAEGIRKFTADLEKLEEQLRSLLTA